MKKNQKKFIEAASFLAALGVEKGYGGPFGAIIVKNGKIVGLGFNAVVKTKDPTEHAEMRAISLACTRLKSFSLNGCVLYTNCEPCPMCLGAIYWARISKVYYANTREDAARIGFDDKLFYSEIAKPLKKRKLQLIQIPSKMAPIVFQDWKDKPDKVKY